MLNFIWAAMILLAVIYGAISGNMSEVTDAALDSAGEAVSLCITMAGVVALWMGLMEIAQKAGLVRKLTRGIMPFLKFMFPRIPKGHPAEGYIATNIIANVLGLGWACTPAGLKAMEALAQLEAERGNPEYLEEESGAARQKGKMQGKQESMGKNRHASNEMCIFLILNISSLQLIPVNMIAYRAQYGSANPTAIIAPAIAATLVSTLVAIVYCKMKDVSVGSRVSGGYNYRNAWEGHKAVGKEYFRAGSAFGDGYGDGMRQNEGGIRKNVSANLELVKGRSRGGKAI